MGKKLILAQYSLINTKTNLIMKMLKNIKFTLVAFMLFVSTAIFAQDFNGAARGLQTGNAAEVAKHFDGNVEVTILKTSSSYSKTQAEMVLRNFFNANAPKSYKAIHNGDSGAGAKYQIGELIAGNKTYRTYLFGKVKGGALLIQEIRIEEN
jgi:hypothetical protein